MFYAISWHDEDFDLLEWDIQDENAWKEDLRCGSAVGKIIDGGDGCYAHHMGNFIAIDDDDFLGEEADQIGICHDEPVAYIFISGPFYSEVEAQYYVDSQILPEDEY
jgi:hypothetical protein